MGCDTHRGFVPRFFLSRQPDSAQEDVCAGERLYLDREDSHHATRVLRLRPGDMCEVVTGDGAVYRATVGRVGERVELTVGERSTGAAVGAVYRHVVELVQALARPAAIDYVIEKGTEVGADTFVLVATAGSPRHRGSGEERVERWRRIAREAAKQSKQTRVPRVVLASSPADALTIRRERAGLHVVLEPGAERGLFESLRDAFHPAGAPVHGVRVSLWVGPEGGWQTDELAALTAAGALTARLGPSVLRTETAGPVAVAIARLALGDW